MSDNIEENTRKSGRIIRALILCGVVVLIFCAILVSSNNKTPNVEKVWDVETTIGNLEAKNYFVIYSDIACPYCVAFENAILENKEEFERYIEDNDILVEVRLSDFLYRFGEARPAESRLGAEAVFCAKNEGKFWEYYDLVIREVWNNYYGKYGKAAFSEFNKLGKDYWVSLGKQIGLGDDFENCIMEDRTLTEVISNSTKTQENVNGMPYFKFNKYVSSGFDLSWGFEYVLMYFEAGLKSAR